MSEVEVWVLIVLGVSFLVVLIVEQFTLFGLKKMIQLFSQRLQDQGRFVRSLNQGQLQIMGKLERLNLQMEEGSEEHV